MFGGAPCASATRTTPARDLHDPPRRVAELEDVAGHALDGEVLVERADERVLGLERPRGSRRLRGSRRPRSAPSSRAPRRPRSAACTSSRCTSAARRPRRVAKPSASIATTASKSARASARYGQARRTSANSSSSRALAARRLGGDLLRQHVERRVVRDDRRSSSPRADRAQQRRALDQIVARQRAAAGPWACRRSCGPTRPTRCSSVAMRCGEPIWQTRSTWPMSMPSSSDAVATSAFSAPVFSRCSASSRVLLRQAAVMRGRRRRRRGARSGAAPGARPSGAC